MRHLILVALAGCASPTVSAGFLEDAAVDSTARAVLLTDLEDGCPAAAELITAWNDADSDAQCEALTAFADTHGAGPHHWTIVAFRAGDAVEGSYTPKDISLDAGTFGASSASFDLSDDPCAPVTAFDEPGGSFEVTSLADDVLSGEAELDGEDVLDGKFEAERCTFPWTF